MDALSYVSLCGHTSASMKDVTEVASFFILKKDVLKNKIPFKIAEIELIVRHINER